MILKDLFKYTRRKIRATPRRKEVKYLWYTEKSVAFIIDTHLVCCQRRLFFWQRPLFNLVSFIWEELYLEGVSFVFLQRSLYQPETLITKRQAKECERKGFTIFYFNQLEIWFLHTFNFNWFYKEFYFLTLTNSFLRFSKIIGLNLHFYDLWRFANKRDNFRKAKFLFIIGLIYFLSSDILFFSTCPFSGF